MKTSSKILVGLLATIFLIITTIFLDIRLSGQPHDTIEKTFKEDFLLGQFDHVLIENLGHLILVKDDHSFIKSVSISDTIKPAIVYKIVNDTLKLTGIKQNGVSYILHIDSKVKSFTLIDSKLSIAYIDQDTIDIKLYRSEINDYARKDWEISHFKFASISQQDSRVDLNKSIIDTLEIEMQKSTARFGKEIKMVQARLNEKSELNIRNFQYLDLQKDQNSRIRTD